MTKEQRVVVVTGASAGVGRATARAFAEEGAAVAALSRDVKRLEQLRMEVEELGGRCLPIALDVSDADAVFQAAGRIEDELGPIDVWVNNAMVTVYSEVKDMGSEEYRRVTEVTYLGTVHGTMAALEHMWERGSGWIIQVGSALAYRAIPWQSAYCGAKHAIQGFSESLRSEIIHHGKDITVTMVQLPALNTPQFEWGRTRTPKRPQPVPPIYQPEVAARAIVWASHHERREFVVGGRNRIIVWLNKFFPGLGDRYLARQYAGNWTDEDLPADRPDNLFATVEGDYAAHGRFDDRAKGKSRWFWVTTHRWVWFVLAAIIGLVILAVFLAV